MGFRPRLLRLGPELGRSVVPIDSRRRIPDRLCHAKTVKSSKTYGAFSALPSLVRLVMVLTQLPFGPAATIVNLTASGVAVCLLYRLVSERGDRFTAIMAVACSLLLPVGCSLSAGVLGGLSGAADRHHDMVLASPPVCRGADGRNSALAHAPARDSDGVRSRMCMDSCAGGRSPRRFPPRQRWLVADRRECDRLVCWSVATSCFSSDDEKEAYLTTMASWSIGRRRSWVGGGASGSCNILFIIVLGIGIQAYLLLSSRGRVWHIELRTWSLSYVLFMMVATVPASSIFRHMLLMIVPLWPLTELNEQTLSIRGRWLLASALSWSGSPRSSGGCGRVHCDARFVMVSLTRRMCECSFVRG